LRERNARLFNRIRPGVAMISVRRLAKPEHGQDLLEYGLLMSLIAVFVLAAVRLLGDQISGVLWGSIANNF
jgi:Flp pilus assembly pilin Flp